MILKCVSLVGLGVCALIQLPGSSSARGAPDDVCWSDGLGRIEVQRVGERNLRLEIDGPTGSTRRELDLAALPQGQRVLEVRASGFIEFGLVLATAAPRSAQDRDGDRVRGVAQRASGDRIALQVLDSTHLPAGRGELCVTLELS